MGFFSKKIKELEEKGDIDSILDRMEDTASNDSGPIEKRNKRLKEASFALRRIGEEAIDPLLGALESRSPVLRFYLILTLLEIDAKRVLKPVIEILEKALLEEKDIENRKNNLFIYIKEILGKNRIEVSQAVGILIKAIDSEISGPSEKLEIAKTLSEKGDVKVIAPIHRALKYDYLNISKDFMYLVNKYGEKSIEYIIPGLNDDYHYARWIAVNFLGKMGDDRVIDPITQLLNDKERLVRNEAKKALKKIEKRRK